MMEDPKERVRWCLKTYLEHQKSLGIEYVPREDAPPPAPPSPSRKPAGAPAPLGTAVPEAGAPPVHRPIFPTAAALGEPLALPAHLDKVRQIALGCTRCRLAEERTKVVFGEGNQHSELMMIGEGPGENEDKQGLPFVGAAGQLLTKIIRAMGYIRGEIYITNIVKCRPPLNRDPLADEAAACRPYLEKQIELVTPKIIIALGRVATQNLLGVTAPLSQLRGRFHEFMGIKVMPTLHPAALLRNPADKPLVWNDVKLVMRELGKTLP